MHDAEQVLARLDQRIEYWRLVLRNAESQGRQAAIASARARIDALLEQRHQVSR